MANRARFRPEQLPLIIIVVALIVLLVVRAALPAPIWVVLGLLVLVGAAMTTSIPASRARTLCGEGRFAEALAIYQRLLAQANLDFARRPIQHQIAAAALRAGDLERAQQALNEAPTTAFHGVVRDANRFLRIELALLRGELERASELLSGPKPSATFRGVWSLFRLHLADRLGDRETADLQLAEFHAIIRRRRGFGMLSWFFVAAGLRPACEAYYLGFHHWLVGEVSAARGQFESGSGGVPQLYQCRCAEALTALDAGQTAQAFVSAPRHSVPVAPPQDEARRQPAPPPRRELIPTMIAIVLIVVLWILPISLPSPVWALLWLALALSVLLGMQGQRRRLVAALRLSEVGRFDEALAMFESMRDQAALESQRRLMQQNVAVIQVRQGDLDGARRTLTELPPTSLSGVLRENNLMLRVEIGFLSGADVASLAELFAQVSDAAPFPRTRQLFAMHLADRRGDRAAANEHRSAHLALPRQDVKRGWWASFVVDSGFRDASEAYYLGCHDWIGGDLEAARRAFATGAAAAVPHVYQQRCGHALSALDQALPVERFLTTPVAPPIKPISDPGPAESH